MKTFLERKKDINPKPIGVLLKDGRIMFHRPNNSGNCILNSDGVVCINGSGIIGEMSCHSEDMYIYPGDTLTITFE